MPEEGEGEAELEEAVGGFFALFDEGLGVLYDRLHLVLEGFNVVADFGELRAQRAC